MIALSKNLLVVGAFVMVLTIALMFSLQAILAVHYVMATTVATLAKAQQFRPAKGRTKGRTES